MASIIQLLLSAQQLQSTVPNHSLRALKTARLVYMLPMYVAEIDIVDIIWY